MSGPAIRFRTTALMTAVVCLLDALATAYAFHFVRSDKYVIYERAALSAEVLNHVLHLGPLATFAILASYMFAVFTAFYFALYRLLSWSLGMTIPALERRLGRKPPRLLMPDAFVATIVIMQGAVVVTNVLEMTLLALSG
jgi:hypothetical protein